MIEPEDLARMHQAELEGYRKGAKNATLALHEALHFTSSSLGDYTWSLAELCVILHSFGPMIDKAVDKAIKEQS